MNKKMSFLVVSFDKNYMIFLRKHIIIKKDNHSIVWDVVAAWCKHMFKYAHICQHMHIQFFYLCTHFPIYGYAHTFSIYEHIFSIYEHIFSIYEHIFPIYEHSLLYLHILFSI